MACETPLSLGLYLAETATPFPNATTASISSVASNITTAPTQLFNTVRVVQPQLTDAVVF